MRQETRKGFPQLRPPTSLRAAGPGGLTARPRGERRGTRERERRQEGASSALGAPSKGRRADLWRLPHDDKAGPCQVLHKPPGDDLRHDLVGVVDALAAFEAQREGERGGEV